MPILPAPDRFVRAFFAFSALALSAAALAAEPVPDPGEPGLGLLEAVVLTLENDPNLRVDEARVVASRGARMIAAGAFDPGLTSTLTRVDLETATGEDASSDSESWSQTIGWQQTLRSGQTLTPQISLDREDGAGGAVGTNSATVSFAVRQPLWRGRDPDVVTAAERAAELELAATRLDLARSVDIRLRAVVGQYWAVRAAQLDLEILRSTEASSRTLLENTRRLVEADVTPPAELVQLEADLASREAGRIDGERRLFAAMRQLGLEIGLEPTAAALLPAPAEPLPETARLPAASAGDFLALAYLRRADLAAARERLRAAEIRLEADEDALRPRLDLVAAPTWSGFVEGDGAGDFYGPILDNVPGLGATLTLDFAFPVRNRVAEGALLQSRAAADLQELAVDQTRQSIGALVPIALDGVLRAVERLERLERAVELFAQTLENEEKKLGAGLSTLLDVLNQRDRLISARQNLASAQTDLAVALVELRFQTGTLFDADRLVGGDAERVSGGSVSGGSVSGGIVRLEDLLTPPDPGAP